MKTNKHYITKRKNTFHEYKNIDYDNGYYSNILDESLKIIKKHQFLNLTDTSNGLVLLAFEKQKTKY